MQYPQAGIGINLDSHHDNGINLCVLCVFFKFSTDPPYISKAKNTGVSVGQKGILSCEASAVPMAEFQWFKEDTRYLGIEYGQL